MLAFLLIQYHLKFEIRFVPPAVFIRPLHKPSYEGLVSLLMMPAKILALWMGGLNFGGQLVVFSEIEAAKSDKKRQKGTFVLQLLTNLILNTILFMKAEKVVFPLF